METAILATTVVPSNRLHPATAPAVQLRTPQPRRRNLHAGPGRLAVGVDINATHTRSATSGIVTGVCAPVHLGRTIAVHEIVVSDDQGRRCSTIRITNHIMAAPRE